MKIAGVSFTCVGSICPKLDSDGEIAEVRPAEGYKNEDGLPLNAYGRGPFCEFRIPDIHPESNFLYNL